MNNDETSKSYTSKNEIICRFAHELVESGADGIVVIFSTTKKGKTKPMVAQFGNELLCSSLIAHAYNTETVFYEDEEE